MRGAVVLVLLGVLLLGACGGHEDDVEADTSAASTTAPRGERLVIRTRMVIADKERAEPIATGEVLEGSTLGGSAFCVGGRTLDSHGSPDPGVLLIARTITCSDGRVRMRLTPDVGEEPQGQTQTGSWKIVRGTGAFEGLRGSGEMEIVYGPADDSPARATLTGTVTG
jgi:hypothetical protein